MTLPRLTSVNKPSALCTNTAAVNRSCVTVVNSEMFAVGLAQQLANMSRTRTRCSVLSRWMSHQIHCEISKVHYYLVGLINRTAEINDTNFLIVDWGVFKCGLMIIFQLVCLLSLFQLFKVG